MSFVLFAVFGLLALCAAAFAAYPLFKHEGGARPALLGPALAAFAVVALGLGAYLAFGQPGVALRFLRGPQNDDMASLITTLSERIRARPNDLQGWLLLGRGYLDMGNSEQAAKALDQAVRIAEAQGKADAPLLALYGVALSQYANEVTPAAEAAFNEALTKDPKDATARYYLGLAAASRGKTDEAIQRWESLLGDLPADAPVRKNLLDQLAALKASAVQQGTAQAPDIGAMVAGLAARLKENPKDLEGWQRLIRAYSVLHDGANAKAALASARTSFAGDKDALAALDQSARENGLN